MVTDQVVGPEVLAIVGAFIVAFMFFVLVAYIYLSFAFSSIGRRAGDPSHNLAWIPGIGPHLIALRAAKMHWWPLLLLIPMFVPFINWIATIIFLVFSTIWMWKMFERIGLPGWWAILYLIPIVNFVIIGVAAWGKGGRKVFVKSSSSKKIKRVSKRK